MTSSSLTSVPPALLDFPFLKKMVSIEHVLAHRGWLSAMRIRGSSLVGPCPIHRGDSNRSFVVSRSRNLWRCFSRCNAGGDVVELVRRLDSLSYRETAFYLASLLGTAAVHRHPARGTADSVSRPFAPFPHRLSLNHSHPFVRKKGILPETARAFEAGFYDRPGFLHNCLAVRLHDPSGTPLGYAGRHLDPNEIHLYGKWKLPVRFPKSQILYNLHRAQVARPDCLVLVECPWSVMRLHQIHLTAIAMLGTALSQTQQQLLLALAPHRVILLLDGDPTGRVATAKIAMTLSASTSVHPTLLAPDTDPDDLTDSDLAAILYPSLH